MSLNVELGRDAHGQLLQVERSLLRHTSEPCSAWPLKGWFLHLVNIFPFTGEQLGIKDAMVIKGKDSPCFHGAYNLVEGTLDYKMPMGTVTTKEKLVVLSEPGMGNCPSEVSQA